MEVISIWNEMGNNVSGVIVIYNRWKVCFEFVSKIFVWVELDK